MDAGEQVVERLAHQIDDASPRRFQAVEPVALGDGHLEGLVRPVVGREPRCPGGDSGDCVA